MANTTTKKTTKPTTKSTAAKTPAKTKKNTKQAEQPAIIAPNTVLNLVIPKKEAEAAYQAELKKSARNLKIDGFRKGKVPANVAEKKIDPQHLIEHAVEHLMPKYYADLIKKEDKHPLTSPEINIVSGNRGEDWKLEVHIAEKPTVKLGDYKKLVKKALKEAAKEIEKRETEAKKDTKSKKTDKATAKDDKKETGLTESQIQEIKLQYIFRELATEIKPEIQELLIKQEIRQQMNKLVEQLDNMGLKLDDYLSRRQIKFEDLSQEMAIQALSSFQIDFILQEIKDTEDINPEDADIQKYLVSIKSDKKVKDLDEESINYLKSTLARRKVIDYLLEIK